MLAETWRTSCEGICHNDRPARSNHGEEAASRTRHNTVVGRSNATTIAVLPVASGVTQVAPTSSRAATSWAHKTTSAKSVVQDDVGIAPQTARSSRVSTRALSAVCDASPVTGRPSDSRRSRPSSGISVIGRVTGGHETVLSSCETAP